MENIFNICNYIIKSENNKGRAVTNLRLQKLLYFIQAYSLKALDAPCFAESIEAWQYGPVVPSVYSAYKFYGSIGISIAPEIDIESLICSSGVRKVIDTILQDAENMSTGELINITHSQRPWIDAFQNGYGRGNCITIKAIRKEFCED